MGKYALYFDVGEGWTDPMYIINHEFDTLEEATVYYDKFDGVEYFDEHIISKLYYDLIFTVEIWYIDYDAKDETMIFLKGKYLLLDLEDCYPDFWKLYFEVKQLK